MLHRSPHVPTIDARATSFRTLSHFFAFFILTTPLLRIVTVERPFRSACGTWVRRFTGKRAWAWMGEIIKILTCLGTGSRPSNRGFFEQRLETT
ncbi:hypothetical protein [Burkholderia anthina]|uniref:hypothetical protein n=1 Tax=Burkholderia anthina TaxID=179879 RepID=UPI000751A902|nr:hypothetical protein [Burkholderia anthina]KVE09273.1 hypothetical protein WS65_08380 [Burkholderia anthina]